MAIIHPLLGKLTGRLGDSVFYEDRAGQNILRALPGERRPGTEAQQRWETEFATLLDAAWLLGEAVHVGFPAGRKYPAREKGFLKANARRAVEVEPIDPERPFVRKKGMPKYFKARVDYARVLVADGTLVTPEVEVAEVRAGDGQAAERWEEGQAKEAGMEGMEEARAAEGKEKRERVVRMGHRGTVRERWECFRGDRVYGAVAVPEEDYCRVHLLGQRGETWEREVRTKAVKEGAAMYVYVFAVTEDGRGVSPSACRAFLAHDAAADKEEG